MKKKDVLHIIILIGICLIPLIFITGCGSGSCIRCAICVSGTDPTWGNYTSYAGPAACTGCGCNSGCWATEYVCVSKTEEAVKTSGCVTFYNSQGCISSNNSKINSEGIYSENSVFCSSCGGSTYTETVNGDNTTGYMKETCFGFTVTSAPTKYKGYNKTIPRQFTKGCCGGAE